MRYKTWGCKLFSISIWVRCSVPYELWCNGGGQLESRCCGTNLVCALRWFQYDLGERCGPWASCWGMFSIRSVITWILIAKTKLQFTKNTPMSSPLHNCIFSVARYRKVNKTFWKGVDVLLRCDPLDMSSRTRVFHWNPCENVQLTRDHYIAVNILFFHENDVWQPWWFIF
jgi:hypothetical protein